MSTGWEWLDDVENDIKMLDEYKEVLEETERTLKNLKEMMRCTTK